MYQHCWSGLGIIVVFIFLVTSRNNRISCICLDIEKCKINLFNEGKQFYSLKIRCTSKLEDLICEMSIHRCISQVEMVLQSCCLFSGVTLQTNCRLELMSMEMFSLIPKSFRPHIKAFLFIVKKMTLFLEVLMPM